MDHGVYHYQHWAVLEHFSIFAPPFPYTASSASAASWVNKSWESRKLH